MGRHIFAAGVWGAEPPKLIRNPNTLGKMSTKAQQVFLIRAGHPTLNAGVYATVSEISSGFQEDPSSIRYIDKPTEVLFMLLVKINPNAICYISMPSKMVMMQAVGANALSIQYIHNPPADVCLRAIKLMPRIIQKIKNPSLKMYQAALEDDGELIRYIPQTSELCCIAVRNTAWALEYIREQTPEMCEIAVQFHPYEAMYLIENLTYELCKKAFLIRPTSTEGMPYYFRKLLTGAPPPDPRR